MPTAFPFSAIVAQEEMKLALLIAAVDQTVGGVLVFGDRGTGKVHGGEVAGGAAAEDAGHRRLSVWLRS